MTNTNLFRCKNEAIASVYDTLESEVEYTRKAPDYYLDNLKKEESEDGYWHMEVQKIEFKRLLFAELLEEFGKKYMKGF